MDCALALELLRLSRNTSRVLLLWPLLLPRSVAGSAPCFQRGYLVRVFLPRNRPTSLKKYRIFFTAEGKRPHSFSRRTTECTYCSFSFCNDTISNYEALYHSSRNQRGYQFEGHTRYRSNGQLYSSRSSEEVRNTDSTTTKSVDYEGRTRQNISYCRRASNFPFTNQVTHRSKPL